MYNICGDVNMKLGLIVAVEMESFLNKYGETRDIDVFGDFEVFKYNINKHEIYVINSGVGEISAASSTQLLISKYDVDIIVNYGIVGSLNEKYSTGDTCLVKSVVHYDFDLSGVDKEYIKGRYSNYPSIYINTSCELLEKYNYLKLPCVICASGDKFISDINKKRELNKSFNADICDMESAGIILTCDKNNIPCILIKCVADSINDGGKEYYEKKKSSSDICIKILDDILSNKS